MTWDSSGHIPCFISPWSGVQAPGSLPMSYIMYSFFYLLKKKVVLAKWKVIVTILKSMVSKSKHLHTHTTNNVVKTWKYILWTHISMIPSLDTILPLNIWDSFVKKMWEETNISIISPLKVTFPFYVTRLSNIIKIELSPSDKIFIIKNLRGSLLD